jgi:hypothetical protein
MFDIIYNNHALEIIKEKYPKCEAKHIPNEFLPERFSLEIKGVNKEDYCDFLLENDLIDDSCLGFLKSIEGCFEDKLDEFPEMEC